MKQSHRTQHQTTPTFSPPSDRPKRCPLCLLVHIQSLDKTVTKQQVSCRHIGVRHDEQTTVRAESIASIKCAIFKPSQSIINECTSQTNSSEATARNIMHYNAIYFSFQLQSRTIGNTRQQPSHSRDVLTQHMLHKDKELATATSEKKTPITPRRRFLIDRCYDHEFVIAPPIAYDHDCVPIGRRDQ